MCLGSCLVEGLEKILASSIEPANQMWVRKTLVLEGIRTAEPREEMASRRMCRAAPQMLEGSIGWLPWHAEQYLMLSRNGINKYKYVFSPT